MDNINNLRDRIRYAQPGRFLHFLKIISTACCSNLRMGPSHEEMVQTFGADLVTTIDVLIKFAEGYARRDIAELLKDDNITEQVVEQYLKDVAYERHIFETLIMIVEGWIEKNKKEFKDSALEAEICAADSDAWINQDNVIELWSDGHITSQKGGELYGHRSVFTIKNALLHNFNMTLPRKSNSHGNTHGNTHTYAVVESEKVAVAFRKRMVEISQNM